MNNLCLGAQYQNTEQSAGNQWSLIGRTQYQKKSFLRKRSRKETKRTLLKPLEYW